MAKIFLVEDDPNLLVVLESCLETEKHVVETSSNGQEALLRLRSNEFDLIVLDWNLPGMPGIEVCQRFRGNGGHTPVLMLTGKDAAVDKAAGLDAGADDYLVKPFDPTELLARVRALLRRPHVVTSRKLNIQGIELDLDAYTLCVGGATSQLTPKELAILELLMKHPNKYFTTDAILQRVWNSEATASQETVRTHIKTLRKKLGADREACLESVRTLGYRFVQE